MLEADPRAAPPRAWREDFTRFGSIVCVSNADWDHPLWTNKQHIMARLATVLPVLYVESLGNRRPRASRSDLARVVGRLRRAAAGAEPPASGAPEVLGPILSPYHERPWQRRLNRRLLALQLARRLARLPRPRVLWSYTPLVVDELDVDAFDVVVYHCVDDYATTPGAPAELVRALERRLVARADVVFASSRELERRLRAAGAAVHLLENVADAGRFGEAAAGRELPPDLLAIPEPRVLFCGALSDHKLDWPLIAGVAERLPAHQFVFVGPHGREMAMRGFERVAHLDNCHLLGWRPYETLPSYLAGAHAAVIPYRLTGHTAAILPMKTYEYLGAGAPVVSTPLPSLTAIPGLPVSFAADAGAFALALQEADQGPDARMRRQAYARSHTWDNLLDDAAAALAR